MIIASLRRRLGLLDETGSMMLVFLVIIVVGAMSAITVTTVVAANKTTRHGQAFHQVLPRADVGVQEALFDLNNGAAASLPTSASPAPLSGGTSTGSWYVTHPKTLQYVVTSTSTQNGVTRTVTATIEDQPRFPLAAFADTSITFRGGNSADSYDHRTSLSNTGDGDTGSNGSIVFNGNATADGVTLYDWVTNADGTRCSGTPCANLTTVGPKLDISSATATTFITNQIASCQNAGPLTAWVASENNYQLTPGVHCYSSMNFDGDTTNLGSDVNPTYIYVAGNVSMDKMINVNIPAAPAYPNATALQIFALGDTVAIGNHMKVGAAIWAPHAACGGNPSNAQSDVYGALVCGSISNQGGWGFHYDDALSSIGTGNWVQSHYAEK